MPTLPISCLQSFYALPLPLPAMANTTTFLFVLLLLATLTLFTSAPAQAYPGTVRAGYYLAASAHLLPFASMDASLYTHIYYSSLTVDPTRCTLQLPADPSQARLLAAFSGAVKSKNGAVKTLLSVATDAGAVTASNAGFAAMAADPAARAAFAGEAVALSQANGFDGLDVAWRFPASAVEMVDFGFLVADLRAAAASGFLVTATVYFSNHVFDAEFAGLDYPSEAVARYLDWINVMAFGLRPATAKSTAFDAPLYDKSSHFSASYGVVSWLDAGVPASKVVMGIPLYGRSWFLRNKANTGLGAPVVAAGPKQRASNATGVMSYAEVEQLAASSRAVLAYNNSSVSSYVSAGDIWVAFDSVTVVEEKLAFAARCELLGYFLSPVSYDDANFTVSRRASDVWLQKTSSPDPKGDTIVRQTQPPVQLPPFSQSNSPMPAPMSSSTTLLSSRWLDAHLHLGVLMFLLY